MQLSRPRPRPADGGSWVRRVLRRRCGRALGRIRIRRRPARASSRGRWRADPSGVTSPRLRRGTPVATPLSERRGVAMNSCAYVCSRCASGEWRCHPTTPPSSQMRRRGVRRQRRRRLRLTRVGARACAGHGHPLRRPRGIVPVQQPAQQCIRPRRRRDRRVDVVPLARGP